MDIEIIGTREMRWPDEDGPWVLRLVFGIVGDRPGVVAVELYAIDPAEIKKEVHGYPALLPKPTGTQAITTVGVRLPLAELTAKYLASAEHSDRIISQSPTFPSAWRTAATERLQLIESITPRRGPGRPATYAREHFEEVAKIYADALRVGLSPTQAVAKEKNVNKSTATKWVAKARELGLLPETVKGKAAGWPTAPKRRRRK